MITDRKVCKGCGELKSVEQFKRHHKARDGFTNRCKDCAARESAEVYAKNRDKKKVGPKRCSQCEQTKSRSEFHRNRAQVDGLQNVCKACFSELGKGRGRKPKPRPVPGGYKRCVDCQEVKMYAEFWRKRDTYDGLQPKCIPCQKLYVRRLEDDPEVKARKRRCEQRWWRENREYALEMLKAYRKKHPEKWREYGLTRYRKSPEKWVEYGSRRRARIANAEGDFTSEQWLAMREYYEDTCFCCGEQGQVTFDHVVPISRGGTNTVANGQPLCLGCNKKKHAKTIDYRDPYLHGEFMDALVAAGML